MKEVSWGSARGGVWGSIKFVRGRDPIISHLHVADCDTEPLGVEVVVEVVERGLGEDIWEIHSHQPSRLITPAPCHYITNERMTALGQDERTTREGSDERKVG